MLEIYKKKKIIPVDLSSGGPWLSFEKIVHEINQHCYKNQKYKNNYNSNGFELQNPKEIRQTKTVSGPCWVLTKRVK